VFLAKLMGQRPMPIQIQRYTQLVFGLERTGEAKREVLGGILANIQELQYQRE
ncbi:unnamed protein product, partial [Prorocentrum cordatum]